MGYSTQYWGVVYVHPVLNASERRYLSTFATTRRMASTLGPYYVGRPGPYGQDHTPDIIDDNAPPEGQPNLWCQWVPTLDGVALQWNGQEKFYDADLWMRYLIDHFLREGAVASDEADPQFLDFGFNHRCNGMVFALAVPEGGVIDAWRIDVVDNAVGVYEYRVPAPHLDDVLDLGDDDADRVDVQRIFADAMTDRDGGVESVAAYLDLLRKLGRAETADRLRDFVEDLALKHPRPVQFRAAVGVH